MFTHVNIISDINEPSIVGFLYLFDVDKYDNDISIILPQNTIKFGKTDTFIKRRLEQYNHDEINMRNIEYIHCSYPKERERLLKAYIKEQTKYRAVQGFEYFVINRELLKFFITVFISISEDDIVLYEKYYSEKQIEYKQLFLRINDIIKEKELNPEFTITIEKQPEIRKLETKQEFICEFCEKDFTNLSNLKYHQKTAKFCIDIQQVVLQKEELFICKFCKKDFIHKHSFNLHIQTCKEQIPYYKKKAKEFEIKNKEYEIKHEYNQKENERLQKEIERLQKENEEYRYLLTRPTTVYNNKTTNTTTNTTPINHYNIQYKKMVSDLTPFTNQNIKESIKSFSPDYIENINDIIDFFIHGLIQVLNKLYFCSDVSRQILVIKSEDENPSKIQAKEFVSKCINIGSDEIEEYILMKYEEYKIKQNINLLIDSKETRNKLQNMCKKDSTTYTTEEEILIKKLSSRLSKENKVLYKQRQSK